LRAQEQKVDWIASAQQTNLITSTAMPRARWHPRRMPTDGQVSGQCKSERRSKTVEECTRSNKNWIGVQAHSKRIQ